jgi:hypothetical protein
MEGTMLKEIISKFRRIPPKIQIMAFPISLILLGGLLGPFVPGLFFIIATSVTFSLLIVLVLHRQIFPFLRWARDAFTPTTIIPYLATGLFASSLFLLLTWTYSQQHEPLSNWSSFGDNLHLSNPIAIGFVCWIISVPLVSSFLANKFRRNKKLVAILFLAAILLFIVSFSIWQFRPGVRLLVFIHLVVLTLGGLVTLWIFRETLMAEETFITRLNEQATIWFILPGSLTVFNLVTIVQGFTGLIDHYEFLRGLAVGGITINVLAILCVLIFGMSFIRRGIKRKNLTHYMLAISFSLSFGCVVMYACAELGGVILKHYFPIS